MCLSQLSIQVKEKYKDKKFGWKIFSRLDGRLSGMYYNSINRPIEEWLDEKDFRDTNESYLRSSRVEKYPTGWHIYLTRASARHEYGMQEVVRKVYFKNPVAWGYQASVPVVVAKKIFISKERA